MIISHTGIVRLVMAAAFASKTLAVSVVAAGTGHGLEGDDISSTECDMSGVCEAGSIGSLSLLVRKARLFPGGLELGELARDLLTDLPLFPALQCLLHALE